MAYTHTHTEDRTHTVPIKNAHTPAHKHTHMAEMGGGVETTLKARAVIKEQERERVPALCSRKAITGQNTV